MNLARRSPAEDAMEVEATAKRAIPSRADLGQAALVRRPTAPGQAVGCGDAPRGREAAAQRRLTRPDGGVHVGKKVSVAGVKVDLMLANHHAGRPRAREPSRRGRSSLPPPQHERSPVARRRACGLRLCLDDDSDRVLDQRLKALWVLGLHAERHLGERGGEPLGGVDRVERPCLRVCARAGGACTRRNAHRVGSQHKKHSREWRERSSLSRLAPAA